ncbi:MAG: NCS2 family nucleobase:cation symporter [Companilactobacillus sp.]|nr:solute carrier family 23 protein [Companilactobacillus sp.]MCH4009092.1 NCS2 family nucleobase:cation symporter [Companilactobacillus sp.]MCH4050729.1 NCS2 family nucleobase:cation symporter [Companilactobacillus sp.]MCH4077034.1 NCS2 family nucleobase:cation symporter [Companilactobacillus sp.]MCH4125610.1 NCS2 family nucleobase:cation symporter [Companilactobacillus sp.]MCI1311319.1 NCS2 family nucleobase:cation symporter [Companilactobacillus sp.]
MDLYERPPLASWPLLSLQHLFSMFGATVLVPLLVGLDPSIALFSSGIGTILHILITKGRIPAYMSSSFSFIVPSIALMKTAGYAGVAQGTIAVGLVYLIVAAIVGIAGSDWIDRALPPIVVGPIVIVIGLSVAGSAANNAMMNGKHYDLKYFGIAMATMLLTVLFNMYLKGFWSNIAILLGIICGYALSVALGIVDFSKVASTPWFKLPAFEFPFISYHPKQIYWDAILSFAPIAFVTMAEHLGHIMVLDELTHRDFFKNPGLHRTLAGDGTASIFAGLVGGPPITSYGENIGVMAVNKIFSVYVIVGAAVFAALFGFVGKLSALIQTIPGPVIGGISFILFGVIASSGLRILVDNKVDFNRKRNLMIASVILVIGIGNAYLEIGTFQFTGIGVATIMGILLNLILPREALSEE